MARADLSARSSPLREHAHWILAAAVFVIALPWLGSEGTYHGDERFYTDAALRMVASGDWWRPEYADGSARLNKPLLVYWLVAAPFQVLGIGLLSARILFLLAGALLVGVTGRLARALFPDEPRAPFLAAAIAASNVALATIAVRATPDVLLALATAIAWVGLADLLVAGRPARAAAPWIWLGIGFAAAAKGSLAIVLVLFVVAAVAWRARPGTWRGLLHAPSIAVGVALAAVSLAPLWLVDARAGGPSFVEDQVTSRLASSPLEAAGMALAYLGSFARHFLPWALAPLALALADRERLRAVWRDHGRALALVVAFAGALWLVFSVANLHRGRYLTPSYPLLSCAAAVFVLPALALRPVQHALRALTWLAAVACALIAIVLVRVEWLAAFGAAVAAAVAFAGARRARPDSRAVAFALASAAFLFAAVPALRHGFRSGDFAAAAAAERVDATWGFDPSTPNVVRVVSHGRLDPREWPESPSESDFARCAVVLARGDAAHALAERGWTLEPCATRTRHMRITDVPYLLLTPDPCRWFADEGERVVLAHRPAPVTSSAEHDASSSHAP